jgi:replication factor A1
MTIKLTRNGIQEIFRTEIGGNKVLIDVDVTLQVVSFKHSESNKDGKVILTCSLSDSSFKYGGFIFVKDDRNLKNLDIVRLRSINHQTMSDKVSHAFIVKKYEIVNSNQKELIGKPEFYKEQNVQAEETKINNNFNNMNINHNNRLSENSNRNFNSSNDKVYMPLSNLTPFSQNFTILVRITKRPTELKTYSNQKGQGKILNFNIIDKDNTEMQITAFNDVAEKVHKEIEENKVYEIRGGQVKINDKKFSTLKSEYRLILDAASQISEVNDNGSIKDCHFDFVSIDRIAELPTNCLVDVIGYVTEASEKSTVKTKNGEMGIRRMKIADSSETQIDVSLWRDLANIEDIKQGVIIAFKNLRVGEYQGKNLNSLDDTVVKIDPNLDEANEIRCFLNNFSGKLKSLQGSSSEARAHSDITANLKTVIDAFDQYDDKSMPVFRVKCYVTNFKNEERNFYPGCPECKRKSIEETYGYICSSDACGKKFDKPTYYYSFSVRVKDYSSEYWVDVFGNLAEKITKMNSEDYRNLILEGDNTKLNNLISEVEHQQLYFSLKPKIQTYNNQQKKRLSAYRIDLIDKSNESRRLADEFISILSKI